MKHRILPRKPMATSRPWRRTFAALATVLGAAISFSTPLIAAPVTQIFQNGSGGYSGIQDTMADSFQTGTNLSSSPTVNTYGAGMRKILLRVSLPANITKNSFVTSAKLSLYASTGDPGLMYLYDLARPWVPTQATWTQYASGLSWAAAGLQAGTDYAVIPYSICSAAKNPNWVTWDVLELARRAVRSGSNSIDVVIMNQSDGVNAGGTEFLSSENANASLHPKLTITYDAATPYANAGPDQDYTNWTPGNRVTLNASGSNDASTPLSSLRFKWSFVEKPGASKLDDTAFTPNNTTGTAGAQPSFTPDTFGTYTIKVSVTNSGGATSEDILKVRAIIMNTSHPRIFLTPERISKLKTLMNANTYEWQHTLSYANGSSYEMLKQYVKAKGLVYILTGNATYGNAAVTEVMKRVASPIHDPGYSTYGIEAVAYGYDWCYNLFTATQRQQVINWLNDEANFLKSNYYGSSSWSNYFIRGMYAVALAGYSTLGDNPQAQSHIDDSWKRWEIVKAGFQLSGTGGGWAEGTGWDGYMSDQLIQYVQMMLVATGEDLYESTPFFRDRLKYALFMAHPGFVGFGYSANYPPYARQHVQIGDGRRGVSSNTVELRIGEQIVLDHYYGKDPNAAGLQWFLTRPPANHIAFDEYMVDEFVYFDPNRIATPPSVLGHFAPGVGEAYFRSDWNSDESATWVGFKSCGLYEGHQHHDANSFVIYKYGDLAIDSGQLEYFIGDNSTINYDRRTIAHNSMLVYDPNEVFKGFWQMSTGKNDGGQRTLYPFPLTSTVDLWREYPEVFDTARVTRYADTPIYSYVMGNATNAYNSPRYTTPGNQPKVSNFTRQLVYVRPTTPGGDDFVVVYDRISSTNANFPKKWLMHTLQEPMVNGYETKIDDHEYTYNGDIFQSDSGHSGTAGDGDGRIFGKVLLPKARVIRKIGGPAKAVSIVPASTNRGTGRLLKVLPGACNIAQTWTMTFTSSTGYTLSASVTGDGGTGDITRESWASGNQLLLRSDCFSGSFVAGDKFTFVMDQGKDFWVFGSNNSPSGGMEPKYGSWRIEVEPTVPAKDDVFLNVLFPTHISRTTMPTVTLVEAATGNMYGAQIGSRVVMFSRTEASLNEPIGYTVTGNGTSRQILMDMTPGNTYSISAGGQSFRATADSQGTLSFDASLNGATQISINGGTSGGGGTTPPASSSISLNKVADKSSAKPQETVTYTISYTNTGGSDANNVVVTDTLPTNTTYVTNSAKLNGAAVTPDPVSSGVLKVTVGTVRAGQSGAVTFQVKVK